MRVLFATARLTAGAVLLLGLGACGSAHNGDLFQSSGTLGESGGASNASGASALDVGGTSDGVGGNPAGASGGETSLPLAGGASSDAGGSSGSAPGDAGGAIGSAGSAGADNSECVQYGSDAAYFAGTQHCYLVIHDIATFAAAVANCKTLGAHLVTLSDADENDFAWNLDSEEHWIGATDGKGPRVPDPGTYAWVTNEPFTYTNWSSGQPNAADTDCGDSGITGHCYEHCAFQWTGGDQDGQWNDRFCLHTIAAICEWEDVH